MLFWNLPRDPKKTHGFPWREEAVCRWFSCWSRWKKILLWFNLQRDGTGNGLFNIKDTFEEGLLLQMSVLHQCMCIFKAGLSMMTGQNIKKKYLMCQISIKMLKQHAISNSILHILNIFHQKGAEKTSHRWIRCMYLCNTAILNNRFFSRRYHFRL